ncbi:MAG: cytidine deaminase [Lachnospiraceae bacterium]|nr:cytidine deaminase [Lachnospiraceae bacterium]
MSDEELIKHAMNAREKAYSPYSKFSVGAAILTEDNQIFEGCNIENATFGATICAERTAVSKAVSEGYRSFKKIAVIAKGDYCYPCGICRQVLAEFCDVDKFEVICANEKGEYRKHKLLELIPYTFKL